MITSITFNKNKDQGYIYNPKYKKVLKKEFADWTKEQIDEFIKSETERTGSRYCLGRNPYEHFYKDVRDGYELPHLVKNLGEKTITFDPDKINVLFGPNGSGKTTIIKEIANMCLCGERDVCDGFTNIFHIEPLYLDGSFKTPDEERYSLENYKKSLSQNGKRNDVSIVWDGGPVYYENTLGRRITGSIGDLTGGLFNSSLDEMLYLANRGQMSLGQNTMYMIEQLIDVCSRTPSIEDFEKQINSPKMNDTWQKTGQLALDYINEFYKPGAKMTLLLDEMDKSLDIENTLLLYRDYLPALQKKFNVQIILVSHSPLMLTNIVQNSPNYNFISIDKNYTKTMKEMFNGVSF